MNDSQELFFIFTRPPAFDGQVVRLFTERKHPTNCITMAAYQAESESVRLVDKHYRRAEDECRNLRETPLRDGILKTLIFGIKILEVQRDTCSTAG
ncbi:MAG: hypothetical protein ABIG11_08285 [bacterium]